MRSPIWRSLSFWSRAFAYALLALWTLWTLLPFLWALVNSLKAPVDTFSPKFIPFLDFKPVLDNWNAVLRDPNVVKALRNSALVGALSASLALGLAVPAAYALARHSFPLPNQQILLWFLSQRIMPPAVVLVPFFVLMVNLRLIDTVLALVLVNTTFTLPLAVVILRDVFREQSRDIEEAAQLDGAGEVTIFLKIALPLARDSLIAAWLICFAFAWNEALFAATLASDRAVTLPFLILASRSTRGVDFNTAAVNTLIAILPPVVLSFFAQRYLARGLSFGAVKG